MDVRGVDNMPDRVGLNGYLPSRNIFSRGVIIAVFIDILSAV